MKSFSFRITVMVVLAFVAIAMEAQESVNGKRQVVKMEDAKAFEALKAEKEAYRIVSREDNGIEYIDSVVVKKVQGVKYFYTYNLGREKKLSDLSLAELEQVADGTLNAYDDKVKTREGKRKMETNIALLGGANYLDDNFAPEVRLRAGLEFHNGLLLEAEGAYTRNAYPEGASVDGKYNSYFVGLNLGYAFWRNTWTGSYLAVVFKGGYGFQRSDKERELTPEVGETQRNLVSTNHGFEMGLDLRAAISVSPRLRLLFEAGGMMRPRITTHGTSQDFGNIGPHLLIGGQVRFWK